MHLHLDAVGGVAGDMFIAAMLDAFPGLRESMLAAIRAAGLPPEVTCTVTEHRDHALTGLRFVVEDPQALPLLPEEGWRASARRGGGSLPEKGWREVPGKRGKAHVRAHLRSADHAHAETSFAAIRAQLQASALAPEVAERAVAIFTLLAEVEAHIHGHTVETVSFHELGGWDSIADIVGAAALIAALPACTWSVSTLPLGRGRTRTAHGLLPVPSPAASRLLEGYEFADDGRAGERVTPTGAAILRHVNATQSPRYEPRRLLRSGHGFGTKAFAGLSNVLRVLVFEDASAPANSERVALIAFEVDDQSPEDLAIALDHLRAQPAVLDVVQMPAFGKKGRMTAHIQVLAQPEGAEQVIEACFSETATLGLRCQIVERRVLARRQESVEVAGRRMRVKLAQRPGTPTAKVESDDLLNVRGGRAARDELRREVQAEGLKKDG